MDNRNYDGIIWCKDAYGYWVNKKHGRQHVYVWQQAHQATVDNGDVIHHINEDKSDNRITNLKLLTKAEHTRLHMVGKKYTLGYNHTDKTKEKISISGRNGGLKLSNTSGYRGVSYDKYRNKWAANIKVGETPYRLGRFPTPEEAARAYDEAARKCFGDDAFLNFPQDNPETTKSN